MNHQTYCACAVESMCLLHVIVNMSEEAQERRESISNDLLDDGGDTTVVPDADESALLDTDPSLGDGELSLLDRDDTQDAVQIDDPV